MSLALAYSGRTFDVLALRSPSPTSLSLVSQSLFNDGLDMGGDVCTGIVKLAQWFLIQLLTPQGSKLYDPLDGTTFISKLIAGQLRTDTDVQMAFGFAVGQITTRARQLQTDATPLDEQFGTATLTQVQIAPGTLTLNITMTSQAGSSWTLIVPIPTVP